MNTLTPPDLGEFHTDDDPGIQAELFPGTEFTLASEQARISEWQRTGECTGPTHIGMIEISPVALEAIKNELMFDYYNLDPEILSEDSDLAAFAAKRFNVPLLSEEVRSALRGLQEAFTDLTQQDMGRSDLATTYEQVELYLYAGMYKPDDDPHIDLTNGFFTPRYITTIAGPSTRFYTGNIQYKNFNSDGDYDSEEPLTNDSVTSGTNVVDRFARDCDPHSVPVDGDGEFRLTLISQFIPKQPESYQTL